MIFPKKPVSQSRNNNYAIILLKHMKMKMHAYIKQKKEKEGTMHTVDGGGKMEPKMLVEEDEVVEGSLGPKR